MINCLWFWVRSTLEWLRNKIIMHSGLSWVQLHSWPLYICNRNSNWNQTKLNHHNMRKTKKNYQALMTLFYSVGPRAMAVLAEAPLSSHQSHFCRELPAVLSCLLQLSHTFSSGLLFRDACPDAEMTSMWSHFRIQPLINHFSKNFWSKNQEGSTEARISCLEYRFLHTAPSVPATSLTHFQH